MAGLDGRMIVGGSDYQIGGEVCQMPEEACGDLFSFSPCGKGRLQRQLDLAGSRLGAPRRREGLEDDTVGVGKQEPDRVRGDARLLFADGFGDPLVKRLRFL